MYSPPRVTKLAQKVHLKPGFAIDLSENDPVDGLPYDLNDKVKRDRVEQRVRDERPMLLIGSPPCTAFSQLFTSNISRMHPKDVKEKVREGLIHLLFCIKLYNIQLDEGRLFLHEHP